jgi:hypothetical protein
VGTLNPMPMVIGPVSVDVLAEQDRKANQQCGQAAIGCGFEGEDSGSTI